MPGFLNPFDEDPMTALALAARADGSGSNAGPAPGPMPLTGATPDGAMPALAASVPSSPAPAASTGPGIVDRFNNAFAGRGFFGDGKSDETIDPATGVPRGIMRESNTQSIMKMGMMLIAAGARQSDDNRAAILAKIPDAMGNTDQINTFAQTRLKMAQMKLAEREQLIKENQLKASEAFLTGIGAGGAGAGGVGVVPPAASPVATPLPTAGGLASSQAAPSVVPPVAAGTPPAIAGTPVPAVPAPVALPTKATVQPPSPPVPPPLTQQEKLAVNAMTPSERPGWYIKRQETYANAEYPGQVYIDPDTNSKMQDYYKHGKKVRTEKLGEMQSTSDVTTIDGQKFVRKVGPDGRQLGLQPITEKDDPGAAEMAKEYVKLGTTIRNGGQKGRQMMSQLDDFQKVIDNKDVYFGTGANYVANARKFARSIGLTDDKSVPDAELATKITNQLALKLRDPDGDFGGLPGATSNRDLSFLLDSVPSLLASREGAQLIKNSFAKMAQMQIDVDKHRIDYLKKNGKLDTNYEVELSDRLSKHQIFTDEERAKIQALRDGAPNPLGDTTPPPAAAKPEIKKSSTGVPWSVN